MSETLEGVLSQLRNRGWLVATHNDYRMGGKLWTFWLMRKGNIAVKGEGRDDLTALAECKKQIAMWEESDA